MRSFHLPGRSPVIARHAMAATSHPAATLVAIETLKRGGNAVDAAIAATALLCVVEPAMTGIGGDCFALIHKPGQGLIALNASGRAPAAATPAYYEKAGIKEIAVTSPHAVTVPGSIDGWDRLLRDHGTMGFADVLAPAIDAAEGGFAVAPRVATDWGNLTDKIKLNDGARQHLLFGGSAPRAGDVIRMPALAATLKTLARDGRDAFYEGPIAEDIVATLTALGGVHAVSDFKQQRSSYVTPISVGYRGVDLYELPPNNQGIVALMVLRMLDRLGMSGTTAGSAERYHIMLETARLAYAARDAFVADPDTMNVPVSFMLSDGFIDDLTRRIDRTTRRADLGPIPRPGGTDTIYLTVVDKDGMAVSFINSLFAGLRVGHRHRQDRHHAAKSRLGICARRQTCERHRSGQASAAHVGAGTGDERRRALDVVRRDGRHVATGWARLCARQHGRLRDGRSGSDRSSARVLRWCEGAGRRGRPGH